MRSMPASYLPLITRMRFFREPEISCSRFFRDACFAPSGKQTELGAYVAAHIHDGLFVDVPCGAYAAREAGTDADMIPLVAALGAAEYREVDLDAEILGERLAQGTRHEHGLRITTVQDDILHFVASCEALPPPACWYVSALQPEAGFCADVANQRDVAVPYLTALYAELARVCKPQDLVILNSADMLVAGLDETLFPNIHPALALPPLGFKLARRCAYDKVHVYVREA